MENSFYVYIVFRPNGVPCYVGKGKGNRWLKHDRKTHNPHLANIVLKSGGILQREKFLDGLTEAQSFELEVLLISFIGREPNGGPLVNQTDGGEGVSGLKRKPESIELMRKKLLGSVPWNKGIPFTAETKEKMRQAKLGKKLSPEHRAKISASGLGKKRSLETRQRIAASRTGVKDSEEKKAILKAANRSRDPDVREKISDGLKRYFRTQEERT